MKSVITLLVLGAMGYGAYHYALKPCARPIEYSVGSFSTQFGVSEAQFKAKILAAENIWEKELGKQLFTYKEGADFTVNLIYDERQQQVDAKQKSEFGLSAVEEGFRNQDAVFNRAKSEYESKLASHNEFVRSFEMESEQYDEDVKVANKRGGASKAEYAELEARRDALNAKVAEINREVAVLNNLQENLNVLLEARNTAAANYNKLVEKYNDTFSGGMEFDQAEYTGDKINIYEFRNTEDLTIALAHELGHALGLDHVENPKSILYYLTGDQDLALTEEDIVELRTVCGA